MANVKVLLDQRRAKSDGTFNIIFRITDCKKVCTINSGVSIDEKYWNEKKLMIDKSHPNSKMLNIKLSKAFFKIEQCVLTLDEEFSIEKLKELVSDKPRKETKYTFEVFSNKLIHQMMEVNRVGNALVYKTTVNRLISYCGKDIAFTEINYKLLNEFNHHLITSGLKQNSISNYFRTIRAIYNKALKEKIVDRSLYPFHDISIKSEKTAKRAVLKEDIAKLLGITLEQHTHESLMS